MKNQKLLLLLVMFCSAIVFAQDISIGKRDKVYSEILQQDREFSVYLPPSYNTSINQKYPVLYILDGDYNFQYVAGFLELQGAISELIPEMILVALSGKGTKEYRRNCKPSIEGVEDSGNAEEMAGFFEKELIPYVNKNYKTADYKILGGHSVGGIFVINTAINHPNLFNDYIAISPALWWADNAMEDVLKNTWGKTGSTPASVYISLANEKGMGVVEFLKKVPKSIMDKNVTFKEFPDETHNSVGLPTYKWALGEIFKNWYLDKLYFSDAEELKTHYAEVQKQYGNIFNSAPSVIGYTNYILRKNDKERKKVADAFKIISPDAYVLFNNAQAGDLMEGKKYEEAEQLLNEALAVNPNNFDTYHVLAKVKLAKNNAAEANEAIDKAMHLANQHQARQWQINELLETKAEINKKQ
ncbi:alpha/beta hydrolase-fold protein [Aequorivita todarodis]|uniref:alpha/beta hydrolase n=1 Tax=Aequorivita todarodis TaxID=2036821 RepID=UPI00234FC0FA|nr:alpha/beta hydrolase-fold protein [Aequorivita todarodis]MDC8000173.1 alpha/beta hydrolase-fold protein [Aequorivita todarodis]